MSPRLVINREMAERKDLIERECNRKSYYVEGNSFGVSFSNNAFI